MRLRDVADRLVDVARGCIRAAERALERQPVAAFEAIERRERIDRGLGLRSFDVPAGFDAPADHHAEHEHEPDDHGPAEEQVEDLTTVEADLDLVLVELGLARHTPSLGTCARAGKISPTPAC